MQADARFIHQTVRKQIWNQALKHDVNVNESVVDEM